MTKDKYRAAYERQKLAREQAEDLLETKSRELYDVNQSLLKAYTTLKEQKAQMLHQEKLASIGQLSAGIAHEINNPTAYVKSNLESLTRYVKNMKGVFDLYESVVEEMANKIGEEAIALRKEIDKGKNDLDFDLVMEDIDDLLTESTVGVERIQEIVKNLKDFSRPDNGELEFVDVNACLDRTTKILASQLKKCSEVEVCYSDLPSVKGSAGGLSQVFVNLLTNATQAIKTGGKIKINTSFVVEKREVLIKIADNGCGMPPKIAFKSFDPFFSTKGVGEGTGLGLFISQGIVKKHSGRMIVDSEEGKGTTFSIYLPIVEEKS